MSDFYRGKKIFITGHTGFKGSWLSKILINKRATVTGYSLAPVGKPNLFNMTEIENSMNSVIGDVRDFDCLYETFNKAQPEIVFHLAAQPLVRESYENPVYTYETNVIGTVNVLECIRRSPSVKSVLNVTTDKVYQNNEWCWGYRENEPLDGFDPYSNSKSCSELVTHSYVRSFFADRDIAVSTARAGNVLGGGDFAKDRLVPDCLRAVKNGETIKVRNPHSIRPFQHVFEALNAYLMIAESQYNDHALQGCYNVGPDERDCVSAGEIADLFVRYWGEGIAWENCEESNAPHEAGFLKLDCGKIKSVIGWEPKWRIDRCMEMVCRFGKVWLAGGNIRREMDQEIEEFFGETKGNEVEQ